MQLTIDLQQNESLTPAEKQEIDQFIEQAIAQHQNNRNAINKLTMDSVTALTVSEARANELSNQGFFKRIWGGITGKNQQISADIDRNITKVQYASQQMIQKLAEQNLLTFDIVTSVNNKLNMLVMELDQEINEIYKTLITFFKQTRSDIIQLENRIDKLERNVDFLHWSKTIEYQAYNGIEYAELPDIEKIICLTNDFYHRSKGEWSTSDLLLLKSTLTELGLPVKTSFSAKAFYHELIEKPALIERLFENIPLEGLYDTESYEAPLVKGIDKLTKLNGQEKYIYETVVSQLDSLNVPYEKRAIQFSMIHQYLLHTAFMNVEKEVNIFDFVVGLLVDLNTISSSIPLQTTTEISLIEVESKVAEYSFERDAFETQEEFQMRIGNIGETIVGMATVIREKYDIETERLPIHIEWDEQMKKVCFEPNGAWICIPPGKAKALGSIAEKFSVKGQFKVIDQEVALFDPTFSDGEHKYPISGGISHRKWLHIKKSVYEITSLAVSPNGKLLAVASTYDSKPSRDITLYDLESGKQIATIDKGIGTINDLCFLPDGKRLAILYGEELVLWRIEPLSDSYSSSRRFELGYFSNKAICTDGTFVVEAESSLCNIYQISSLNKIKQIEVYYPNHLILSKGAKFIAFNERRSENHLFVFDRKNNKNHKISQLGDGEKPMSFTPNEEFLITEDDTSFTVWNIDDKKKEKTICKEQKGFSVNWSDHNDHYSTWLAGNDTLVYANGDLFFYSIQAGNKIKTLSVEDEDIPFTKVAVSLDARVIAASDGYGNIVVWR